MVLSLSFAFSWCALIIINHKTVSLRASSMRLGSCLTGLLCLGAEVHLGIRRVISCRHSLVFLWLIRLIEHSSARQELSGWASVEWLGHWGLQWLGLSLLWFAGRRHYPPNLLVIHLCRQLLPEHREGPGVASRGRILAHSSRWPPGIVIVGPPSCHACYEWCWRSTKYC